MRKVVERRMNIVVLVLLGLSILAGVLEFVTRRATSHPTDLIAEGTVSVEPDSSGDVKIPHAHAFVTDGTLTVTGIIRFNRVRRSTMNAVQVLLLAPDGSVSDQATCWCRSTEDPKTQEARFSAQMRTIPSSGGRIRVRYDKSQSKPAAEP